MKKIGLTRGKFALVDDEDFERVNQYKWHVNKEGRTVYAVRKHKMENGKLTKLQMHSFIIGKIPGLVTDHIDGDGLNNQKHNLRHVTRRQNCQNRVNITYSSKYPGVIFYKRDSNWMASITIDGKKKHIGYFDKEIEAFNAYEHAVRTITGQLLVTDIRGGMASESL